MKGSIRIILLILSLWTIFFCFRHHGVPVGENNNDNKKDVQQLKALFIGRRNDVSTRTSSIMTHYDNDDISRQSVQKGFAKEVSKTSTSMVMPPLHNSVTDMANSYVNTNANAQAKTTYKNNTQISNWRQISSVSHSTMATTKTVTNNSSSAFAYAFLLGGCNVTSGSYRGMLYNILIATHILQTSGSTADVVVFVQMSSSSSNNNNDDESKNLSSSTTATSSEKLEEGGLPKHEIQWLETLKIRIIYLPQVSIGNFHQINMQKFIVLDLVDYERVLFLDSDVMPLCNLDYIFRLSLNNGNDSIIKDNLILAWGGTPSNGGFFLVHPKIGDYQLLKQIITQREKYNHQDQFSEKYGWGYEINKNNTEEYYILFEPRKKRRKSYYRYGHLWNFHAAFSDQGLLYHWMKYVKQSVTIVAGDIIENWGGQQQQQLGYGREKIEFSPPKLEKRFHSNPFQNYTCLSKQDNHGFLATHMNDTSNIPPYRDFIHFQFSTKPWENSPDYNSTNFRNETPLSSKEYWFHMLRIINVYLDMGLDIDNNWEEERKRIKYPPLGRKTKTSQLNALRKNNVTYIV